MADRPKYRTIHILRTISVGTFFPVVLLDWRQRYNINWGAIRFRWKFSHTYVWVARCSAFIFFYSVLYCVNLQIRDLDVRKTKVYRLWRVCFQVQVKAEYLFVMLSRNFGSLLNNRRCVFTQIPQRILLLMCCMKWEIRKLLFSRLVPTYYNMHGLIRILLILRQMSKPVGKKNIYESDDTRVFGLRNLLHNISGHSEQAEWPQVNDWQKHRIYLHDSQRC